MTGECKIALIVGSNTDVSPGIDNGLWRGVAERGKAVLDYCVLNRFRDQHGPGGGHGVAGISHIPGILNV